MKIVVGGMYADNGAHFSKGNPISREKNRFIAYFTTGIRRIQVKYGGGGCGGGACSLVRQPVKILF